MQLAAAKRNAPGQSSDPNVHVAQLRATRHELKNEESAIAALKQGCSTMAEHSAMSEKDSITIQTLKYTVTALTSELAMAQRQLMATGQQRDTYMAECQRQHSQE